MARGNSVPVWQGFDAGAPAFGGTPSDGRAHTRDVKLMTTNGSHVWS